MKIQYRGEWLTPEELKSRFPQEYVVQVVRGNVAPVPDKRPRPKAQCPHGFATISLCRTCKARKVAAFRSRLRNIEAAARKLIESELGSHPALAELRAAVEGKK